MATTVAQLAKLGAEVAFVLEWEGTSTLWTSTTDTAGISTAWGGTHTVRRGLKVTGSLTRRLDLLGFTIDAPAIGFEIADGRTGALATLLADADETALSTYVTIDVDRNDTTINVKSTAGFPSSGTIYIGHERITYTNTTATSFTGCTRGTFPWGGKASWGHTHRAAPADGSGVGVEVSNKPRVWANRGAMLYIVAKDTTGAWCVKADAVTHMAGILREPPEYDGERVWTGEILDVAELMEAALLRDQWTATIEGFDLVEDETVFAGEVDAGTTVGAATITVPAGHYSLESLLEFLNEEFTAAKVATDLTYDWSLSLVYLGSVPRIHLQVFVGATSDSHTFSFSASGVVGAVLGFPAALDSVLWVPGITPEVFEVNGSGTPIKTLWYPPATSLTVVEAHGTFNAQPADELPAWIPSAQGYVQFGDSPILWLASLSGDTLTRSALWTFAGEPFSGAIPLEQVVYVGEDKEITLRQVWIAAVRVSKVVLRMLLSTGTSGYNDATYDVWPEQMGLAVPSTLVDIPSILALDSYLGPAAMQNVVVTEPMSSGEAIEKLQASLGFHLVWRNGKLAATAPGTVIGVEPEWELTLANLGTDRRMKTKNGRGDLRNKAVLHCNRDPISGDFNVMEVFDNLPSQSEHGPPQVIEFEAPWLFDPGDGSKLVAWRENVAAVIMAYFGRAFRRYSRSGNRTLIGISVADVVTLTHQDAPDQATGTYALDEVPGQIIVVTFNHETFEYDELTTAVRRARTMPWAPCGMLDYDRGDFGNIDEFIYLREHEFSRTTEDVDASRFLVGDFLKLVAVDDGTTIDDLQVVAITGSEVELDQDISGVFDDTKRWYVQLENYGDNTTTREDTGTDPVAFIGDDADDLIEDDVPSMLWGVSFPDGDTATPDGDGMWRRLPSFADDDGEPNSSWIWRDMGQGVNNLYRHVTNQHPIDDPLRADLTIAVTTYGLIRFWRVVCPPGVTTLLLRIYVRTAGSGSPAAKFRATASPTPPGGATAAPTYGTDKNQVETADVSGTSLAAVDIELPLFPNAEGVCYVTLEAKGINTNDQAICRGISGSFEARDVTV